MARFDCPLYQRGLRSKPEHRALRLPNLPIINDALLSHITMGWTVPGVMTRCACGGR
jgi:hypothetical protein